jgi:uncharacterized membrane protein SpoIIM required for sporulation
MSHPEPPLQPSQRDSAVPPVPQVPAIDVTRGETSRAEGIGMSSARRLLTAFEVGLQPITKRFKLPGMGRRPPKIRGETTRVAQRSSGALPVSSFDADQKIDLDQPRTAWFVWLMLGFMAAVVAQGAAWWFFHGTDTFGGALMFAIAALAGFVFPLFQRNAKEIWSRRLTPLYANLLLFGDLLLLFAGLMAGFLAVPLALGMTTYAEVFSGIARFVDVRRTSLGSFDFSGTREILQVNVRVAMVFFLIGLLFRYVGTLIVVVWNASTWGVVFAAALAGGLVDTGTGIGAGLRLGAVVLPHLLVETAAYLCSAMAGIFLSKAVQRYRFMGERFEIVGRSVLSLLAVSLALVVLAALLEGIWGRWLAGLWFHQLPVWD